MFYTYACIYHNAHLSVFSKLFAITTQVHKHFQQLISQPSAVWSHNKASLWENPFNGSRSGRYRKQPWKKWPQADEVLVSKNIIVRVWIKWITVDSSYIVCQLILRRHFRYLGFWCKFLITKKWRTQFLCCWFWRWRWLWLTLCWLSTGYS